VSRCSSNGPNSIDGLNYGDDPSSRHSVYSGPDSILSLNNANPDIDPASDAGGGGGAAVNNEKLAINKVVKYFENRLLNLQVENAKLKVEDDSGAFSSLAGTDSRESPKPPPDVDTSAAAADQLGIRVDSIQVLSSSSQDQVGQETTLNGAHRKVSGSSRSQLCVKCMASLADVTPWTLISEALEIMKGTFNIELGKFTVSLRMLVRHHSRRPRQANNPWLDKWLAGLLALVGLLSISRQMLVAVGLGWVLDGVLGYDQE